METSLLGLLDETFACLDRARESLAPRLEIREIGRVASLGKGIARLSGLPGVRSEEVLSFPGGLLGLAFNIDPGEVGAVLRTSGKSGRSSRHGTTRCGSRRPPRSSST